MIVRDRVGGGGRAKLGGPAGAMGLGADANVAPRPCEISGEGRVKPLSAGPNVVGSCPTMSPEGAGVGGRLTRGITGMRSGFTVSPILCPGCLL